MGIDEWVTFQRISTPVSHVVRTVTMHNDMVGWVKSGQKRLISPAGTIRFDKGSAFLIPRSTQWDMRNEASPCGRYEARILAFAPSLIDAFREQFGQFSGSASVQGCASTTADDVFLSTFSHAVAALQHPDSSKNVRVHRALEVLLMLAERGIVFSPLRILAWADRMHRLVSQRPHARWTLDEVASAFHMSAITLQRRLADEGTSFSRCLREARLETAMALLHDPTLQVSEVASRCGYESHSRFSSAFRNRFGFTPSHLRS